MLLKEIAEYKKDFDNFQRSSHEAQIILNEADVEKHEYSTKISALEMNLKALEAREKSLSAELTTCKEEEARLKAEKNLATLEGRDVEDMVNEDQGSRVSLYKNLKDK